MSIHHRRLPAGLSPRLSGRIARNGVERRAALKKRLLLSSIFLSTTALGAVARPNYHSPMAANRHAAM
jgi:hypothetical protein